MNQAAILAIVREYAGMQVSPEAAFEDLKIDSLEFIAIVHDVEQTLHVIIPNDRLSGIHTIRDLVNEALSHSN
jgi:acyl carrier protein